MIKEIKSNKIVLYNYANFIGHIILPDKINIFMGDEIDVDFDDQKIEFCSGKWDRPTGVYCFPIHFLKDFNENEVGVVQFAMEYPE